MVVHGLGHTKALGGHCNDTRAGKLPGRCEPARVLFHRPWAMHWAMHWATFLSWVTLQQILQVRYSIFLHHGTIWYPLIPKKSHGVSFFTLNIAILVYPILGKNVHHHNTSDAASEALLGAACWTPADSARCIEYTSTISEVAVCALVRSR